MESKIKYPEKEYPYLAVWVGENAAFEENLKDIKSEDILLISKVPLIGTFNVEIYVQSFFGGKKGYVTNKEDEYQALPKGFSIEIIQ